METRSESTLRPSRRIGLAVIGLYACALMHSGAFAQIGGSGWSSATVSYKVQWPYNVAQDTRLWYRNNLYHCPTYSNGAPCEQGSTTLPRTEMRFNPDF